MQQREVTEHHARWSANRETATALQEHLPGNAWALVVEFYAALHLLEAYLKTKPSKFHAATHDERTKAIANCSELCQTRDFRKAYKQLQDVSEQVRYAPGFVPREQDFLQSKSNLATVELFIKGKVERTLSAIPGANW